MASDGTRWPAWRAAAVLAAVVLAAVGAWAWQRPGNAPAYEVVVVGSPSDERPLVAAAPPAAPASPASPGAAPAASQPEPDVSLSSRDAAPAASTGKQEVTELPGPGVEGASEEPEPSCDQAYTYWDGDAQRTVMLCSADAGGGGGVGGQASGGATTDPLVFRSEQGVEMTLEHSIVLVLDPDWSRADVDRLLARYGIRSGRVSPLDWLPNGFTIATGPGVSSLVLANALAQQDGVVLSSPNWASEVEAK